VARLEALDGRVDIGIEGRRNAGALRQVARHHQPLAQRNHVGIIDAKLQLLGRGNLDPAALGDDVLILRDGLLGEGNGLQAEDRQRRGDLAAL